MRISTEVKNLLDKLYNLRGNDSVILTKMNKEREEAIETHERTKNEKQVLIEKIDSLAKQEESLTKEGENLTQVLGSINRADYATVLDALDINFDPEDINAKINSMLPDTISKIVSERESANNELETINIEMKNAITKVEELGIRKDEALSNQKKLNEYFALVLSGNINITREEIMSLLEKFSFSEEEQREAAKLLMFPEDGLYEYDESIKNKKEKNNSKTITDVLVEAKKESSDDKKEIIAKEEQKAEEEINVAPINVEESILEDVFDKVLEENIEEFKKIDEKTEKEVLINLLKSLGVDTNMFSEESQKKVLANYDEKTIKTNVTTLRDKKISLDILKTNVELLYDKELSKKLEKLLDIGKDAKDISLMPEVLVKYDLRGLTNTINVLQISGLDPKKVPLMAY